MGAGNCVNSGCVLCWHQEDTALYKEFDIMA